jgi:hypothetical protein
MPRSKERIRKLCLGVHNAPFQSYHFIRMWHKNNVFLDHRYVLVQSHTAEPHFATHSNYIKLTGEII